MKNNGSRYDFIAQESGVVNAAGISFFCGYNGSASTLSKIAGKADIAKDGLISLGYLLTAFLGPALTKTKTGTNVTFIFECANDSSGAHFDNNIAEFPLLRSKVKKVLSNLFGDSKITIVQSNCFK